MSGRLIIDPRDHESRSAILREIAERHATALLSTRGPRRARDEFERFLEKAWPLQPFETRKEQSR